MVYNNRALPNLSPNKNSADRSEWFRGWFNELYPEVYSHRDRSEAERFASRWQIWEHLRPGDRCLDLGCGTGRYSRILAGRGLKVLAIDLSPAMLRLARIETAGSGGAGRVWIVRADMRRLPARGGFKLAVSLFTSFGYFPTEAEDDRLLSDVAEQLEPGGFLVMDLPNREFIINRVRDEPVTNRSIGQLQINEERRWNDGTGCVTKRITINSRQPSAISCQPSTIINQPSAIRNQESEINNQPSAVFHESVRLYEPERLLAMTRDAGLEQFGAFWGDYNRGALTAASPRMVYFGRKLG